MRDGTIAVVLGLTCLNQGFAQDPASGPSANELIDQAKTLLPRYVGENRHFLIAGEPARVRAARHILEAALELEPENTVAWWWLGHVDTLQGEDRRNRNAVPESREHYLAACRSFDAALRIEPTSYWAWYARGVANIHLDNPWSAIVDLDASIAAAETDLDADDAATVRFKARQWRAEARMRALQFEKAREEFRAFYADYGNNRWDLSFAIAETHLRERDFESARAVYESLLTTPEFARYDAPHAALGYLAGLRGDRAAASRHLEKAAKLEFPETVYPPLWRWMLAPDDERAAARAALETLLDDLPDTVSSWDEMLVRFAISAAGEPEFLSAAGVEQRRRQDAREAPGDLMCEAWFYVGWRRRADGETARALEAFRQALEDQPSASKWEWEFSRVALAELAPASVPDVLPKEARTERLVWNRAGEVRSRQDVSGSDEQPFEWRVGDAVDAVLTNRSGDRQIFRTVAMPR